MIIGTFTYLLFTAAQTACVISKASGPSDFWKDMYIPLWVINLVLAVFNGWGNALLFVGSATYVNHCANEQNKGIYNAILWCGNTGSFITGNIIAAFVIPVLSQTAYFIICLVLLVISMAFFLLLKVPEEQP